VKTDLERKAWVPSAMQATTTSITAEPVRGKDEFSVMSEPLGKRVVSALSSSPSSELQKRIRRSRSIGNINEYRSQLQRLEKFMWELPGKIKNQHHIITGLPRRLAQRHKR